MKQKIKATESDKQVSIVFLGELYQIGSGNWDLLKEKCIEYNKMLDGDFKDTNLDELEAEIEEILQEDFAENSTISGNILDWVQENDSDLKDIPLKILYDRLDSPEFIYRDSKIYLKGFNTPVPKQLVINLVKSKDKVGNYTYDSLINFWKQLVWNPDKHVRNGAFEWLKTGSWAITNDGNIITYRDVDVKQKGDKGLNEAITLNWGKIKRWKKSPKNYVLVLTEEGEYCTDVATRRTHSGEILGNLQKLYESLDNDFYKNTIYKGQHPGEYGQHIEIGKPVSMPREETDNDPNASCSRGLHQKSLSYGLGFGSVTLVCLVSPFNIVAVPNGEFNKMRTCEYLPIGVLERNEYGSHVQWEDGTYDIEYEGMTAESLYEYISNNQISVLKRANLISQDVVLDDNDVANILLSRIVDFKEKTV